MLMRPFCRLSHLARVLVATLSTVAGLAQAQTVHWYKFSFPPYVISEGADANQGISDLTISLLSKSMPEYKHVVENVALPRVLDLVKNGPDACGISLLRTPERAAVMDFSLPYLRALPNGIVVPRKRAADFKPFLNARSELELERLLASGKLKLGLSPDRSYGTVLDPILRRHASSIVMVNVNDLFASRLLKLATQDDFDAILGYSVELTYTTRHDKLDRHDFVIYPIAEASTLLPFHIACSRTEQGQRILAAIDRVLADPATRHRLDGIYRSWLDYDSAVYYDRHMQSAGDGK